MSFGARRVEIMTETGIMGIVIDFTKQQYKNFICNAEWRNLIWQKHKN